MGDIEYNKERQSGSFLFCFTETNQTDVSYCVVSYFPNFQKDISSSKKVISHEYIYHKFGHVVRLVMALTDCLWRTFQRILKDTLSVYK